MSRILQVALVAALLAAGTATAGQLITGKDVKDGSLTGVDVKQRSVGSGILTAQARKELRGARGERGPSDAFAARGKGRKQILNAEDRALLTRGVPAGDYTVMAKAVLLNTKKSAASPNCQLVVSTGGRFSSLDQVNDVPLAAQGTTGDTVEAVLMGFAELTGGSNTFQLRCTPGAGENFVARDRVLVVTQVGEVR